MLEWLTGLFEEMNKVTVFISTNKMLLVHSVFSAAVAMLEEQQLNKEE